MFLPPDFLCLLQRTGAKRQLVSHALAFTCKNLSSHQVVGWSQDWGQFVIAAHRTARSRAIGSSFLGSKKATINRSEKIAPPIASTLHQLKEPLCHGISWRTCRRARAYLEAKGCLYSASL